jgi:ornithine carbamoyltransferase
MTTLRLAVPTDFLRVSDIDAGQLAGLLDLAAELKARPRESVELLRGESMISYFEKPSTRTRVSFAAAAERLGMNALAVRRDELQLGRGEPIGDTGRVLSSYVVAIAIRTFAQQTVEELAAASTVPVINALSDTHHPCQALADLLTVRERFGQLHGLRLAYVGDGNNVAHSLLEAGALAGMTVAVASPPGYRPDDEVVETAKRLAQASGAVIELHERPEQAVEGANAVYTDVWVSMGEEAERERRLRDLAAYQVNSALMARAKPDAIFMHCLPAHRGQEVTADVIDGPQSAVWEQAANRLPTEQALLAVLVSGDWHPQSAR